MKALRVRGGQLFLDEVPRPQGEGEAVVRVLLSGICTTDLEIVRGYSGFEGTIGHEFVGVAEEAVDSPDLVGKRVVGEINAGCGTCDLCIAGDQRHCPNRTVLGIVGRDGAHAEFLRLPTKNLLTVPDNVTNEQAVFAEPLAAAFGITEQVAVDENSHVAVVGDGKLGVLCAMSLHLRSPHVTLVGRHRSKMAIAEKCGVTSLLDSELDTTYFGIYDVVVEASGSETGFVAAMDLVRPRGKIVLKSTFSGTPTWASSRVVVNEITIVGSRCGRFAPALELLSDGSIEVTSLIDRVMPLTDGVEAMRIAAAQGSLKVLLSPHSPG